MKSDKCNPAPASIHKQDCLPFSSKIMMMIAKDAARYPQKIAPTSQMKSNCVIVCIINNKRWKCSLKTLMMMDSERLKCFIAPRGIVSWNFNP